MDRRLPDGGLALASLGEQVLQPGVKGLPLSEPMRQGAISVQRWNVLRGDTSYPVALLKETALLHNLDWMHRFCARHGAVLAPHGKTTMCPQLFGAQIANGAWGMTLATAAQVQVAYRFGVRRVLLANQLVAHSDIRAMVALMKADSGFELIALADSEAAVQRLSQAAVAAKLERPLPLLVELGLAGKRAGCRTPEQALALARAIRLAPGVQLAGIEGYEGLLHGHDRKHAVEAVQAYLAQLVALVRAADQESLFEGGEIILSAGGSAYFDLVARGFAGIRDLSRAVLPVLRSGCYLTNDHGFYQDLTQDAEQREHLSSGLRPALEVWSMVLSRPEPDLAILSMGKRDASYDMELPLPLYRHRPGAPEASGREDAVDLPPGCRIDKMNDQHAYLRLPQGDPLCQSLQVGDLVGCGISHPCTTFDKWPLLLVVDDAYTVRYAVNTFF